MEGDELKALLDRYVEEVWMRRSPQAVERFLAPTYRRHLGSTVLDRDGQRRLLENFQRAFPNARLEVEQAITDGHFIAFRSTIRGTHTGLFQGIPPTGRHVLVQLLDMIRVEDGRIVEQWGGPDLHDLFNQLEASVSGGQGEGRPIH